MILSETTLELIPKSLFASSGEKESKRIDGKRVLPTLTDGSSLAEKHLLLSSSLSLPKRCKIGETWCTGLAKTLSNRYLSRQQKESMSLVFIFVFLQLRSS
jgi:hypothetical protein